MICIIILIYDFDEQFYKILGKFYNIVVLLLINDNMFYLNEKILYTKFYL